MSRLLRASERMKELTEEAFQRWDADEDMKLGKLLKAMSGHLPGYLPDIDEFHTALAEEKLYEISDADEILERFVQTEPTLQQQIVLKLAQTRARVCLAIERYEKALENREHGDIAAHKCVQAIRSILR